MIRVTRNPGTQELLRAGGIVVLLVLGAALFFLQCSKKTIKATLFTFRGAVTAKDSGSPLRNVEILLNANSRDTTDASGRYSFVEEVRTDRQLNAVPVFDSLPDYTQCGTGRFSVPAGDTVWVTNFGLCRRPPAPPCTCTVSR
jgi:hypothetical protein